METVGIICEYNPLHLGHQKQFRMIRQALGEDTRIVCLMSGNFVQRGAPAIFHRSLRAKAAILAGADLVLQMPVTVSLSSAEGFAAGSVAILDKLCDRLCFGAETPNANELSAIAQALLTDDFSVALHRQLDKGLSFPAARQLALAEMGLSSALLETPNNILAVEYCKAIQAQKSSMKPMPIHRVGDYHNVHADMDNPSATSVRTKIEANEDWLSYIPEPAQDAFQHAIPHTLKAGERAVLARLRSMTEQAFSEIPFGSEGLWRKLMHAVEKENTLEAIATSVKSKRYTRSRIDRMILCGFLGIAEADLSTPAPYARVLALNENGGKVIKSAKNTGFFPNIGEKTGAEYELLEQRCDSLYGLFACGSDVSTVQRERVFIPKA